MICKFLIAISIFACWQQGSLAVPVNDQKAADELGQMKTSVQLTQLQVQLEKLQKDLSSLRNGDSEKAPSPQNGGVLSDSGFRFSADDSDSAGSQQRRGGKKAGQMVTGGPEEGIFYDKPVAPAARVLVGWQPLKREHDPSNQGSFRFVFNEPVSLRQEMVEAVENHLLQDLEAARKYGIEPQEILQDLRQKHNN